MAKYRGTNNYIGDTKMNSGSDSSATYTGYYAASSSRIFIRSYIDAVDTLYTTYSSLASGVSMDTNSESATYGVITFANAGYYNIFVTNGVVTIESYNVSNFFKLNDFNTSNKANQAAVKGQKTALILEVPFTCNNDYDSKVSLKVDYSNLNAFIGTAFYVSSSRISDDPATVYSTLITNDTYGVYSSLSNASTITDVNNLTITAGSASTYYAYIVIDYLYNGNYTNFNNSVYLAANMSFYLNGVQYVS